MIQWIMASYIFLTAWWSPNGYFRKTTKSATDVFNASFDEAALGKHPKNVYLNGSEKAASSAETKDEEKQRRLWDFSVKITGLKQNETVLKIA